MTQEAAGRVVLDASAVLALVNQEPGAATVLEAVPNAIVSTVNWSEVLQKALRAGAYPQAAIRLRAAGLRLTAFDADDADAAARLWETTRQFGLSFADRACLVTASRLGLPAWTADKGWTTIDGLPAQVVLIR